MKRVLVVTCVACVRLCCVLLMVSWPRQGKPSPLKVCSCGQCHLQVMFGAGADSLCEGKLIGACVHLGLHDYSRAEQCAEEGRGMLGALPLPLRQHFSSCFQCRPGRGGLLLTL